jgi:anti-anti-sigma regulatory factor
VSVPPAAADASGHLVIFASRKLRCARVSLVGTLDLNSASFLTNWAREFSAGPLRAVRVEASGLRFVDISGIRALAEACCLLDRRCGSFALTALPAEACRLVLLTGIDVPGRRCSSAACVMASGELSSEAEPGLARVPACL